MESNLSFLFFLFFTWNFSENWGDWADSSSNHHLAIWKLWIFQPSDPLLVYTYD